MLLGPVALGVEVDVGPVGHVVAEALEEPDELELAAEELPGPVAAVGSVEAHDPGAVGRGAVGAGVEVGVAPRVVGLPRGHGALHQQRCRALVVTDDEGDERRAAVGAHQLEQVLARRPGGVGLYLERGVPVGLAHVGRRVLDPVGLGLAGLLGTRPDQSPAPAAVVTDPVGVDPPGRCGRRDPQHEALAEVDAGGVGEAAHLFPHPRVVRDLPLGGPGLGVLGGDPVRSPVVVDRRAGVAIGLRGLGGEVDRLGCRRHRGCRGTGQVVGVGRTQAERRAGDDGDDQPHDQRPRGDLAALQPAQRVLVRVAHPGDCRSERGWSRATLGGRRRDGPGATRSSGR